MQQTVTLSVPNELVQLAANEGRRTDQSLEQVMEGWLGRAGNEAFESMTDEDVLAVCDAQMSQSHQQELSDLLYENREGQLDETSQSRLQELMDEYQYGTLRKARALKIAVDRGLRSVN